LRLVYENSFISAKRTSGPINYETLAKTIGSTRESIRITTYRLVQRNLISLESKNGTSGYVEFTLHPELYNYFSQKLNEKIHHQTVTETVTETVKKLSSSISSNINTTNTRQEEPKAQTYKDIIVPSEWLPMSDDNPMGIVVPDIEGFHLTEDRIRQIYTRGWCSSSKMLQTYLNYLEFDIKISRISVTTNPTNYFMGTVKNGYNMPPGYKSRLQIQEERLLEELKQQNENLKKVQAENFEIGFDNWWNGLSSEEQKQISPPSSLGEKYRTTKARMYYRSEILGEKKESV